jgi:hypothetical protein
VGIAALVSFTLAAVAGFGGGVVMLPVIVWAFGVRDAIPILTIAQLMSNSSRVWFNRSELSLPVVRWFALGAMPAAVIGGIAFANAPAAALVRILGIFLLSMVVYRHTRWGRQMSITLRGFFPLGIISGFLSALLGIVGPFMAPFFLAYGLLRGAYIGTEALATVTIHVTKLGVYGSYSFLTPDNLLVGFSIGVVAFLGSYLGRRILARVPDRIFPIIIESVLVISGALFLIRG